MYYIIKFKKCNSIGIVKKSWMINKNKCRYPKTNQVLNLLHESDNKYDTTKWKQYDCILKFPSKYGDEGIKDLKTAKKKEAFYVSFSDTDDFEKKETIKSYYKQHPVSKLSEKSDLNHLVPNKAKVINSF